MLLYVCNCSTLTEGQHSKMGMQPMQGLIIFTASPGKQAVGSEGLEGCLISSRTKNDVLYILGGILKYHVSEPSLCTDDVTKL